MTLLVTLLALFMLALTPPTLVNPQNPVTYGADATGVNDSGAAFQNAINAGDLNVPAGDFRIDTTVNVPSNRNMQCVPNSDLRYTAAPHSSDWFMFWWLGTTGGSVFNCHFRGPNFNVTTGKVWINHALDFLEVYSSASSTGGGQTFANNDFNGVSGYVGAIHLYSPGPQPAPTNVLIDSNTFENCQHYGVQLTAGRNNNIIRNVMTDCNGYIESDNATQQVTANWVGNNRSTYRYGTGYYQNNPSNDAIYTNYTTCGSDCSGNACSFAGNTCWNNLIDGPLTSALRLAALGGTVNNATYVNNVCVQGCVIVR